MSGAQLHNASWWAGILFAILQVVLQLTGTQVPTSDVTATAGVLAALIVGAAYAHGQEAKAQAAQAPTTAPKA